MTIREESLVKARTKDICERVATELDLGWLRIKIKFDPKNDSDRVLCEAICDWEYRQSTIMWNLAQVAILNDDEIEEVFIHELVHVLIAPVWNSLSATQQNKLYKLNELATENVARAISFARNKTTNN